MHIIVDCQLFPNIDYFKNLAQCEYIEIETFEYFGKTSFRNRYVIAGANGLIHLTVPVAGGREQRTLFTEVEIDNTIDWRTKHWRSIQSSYSNAPFIDYYHEEIKSLLFQEEKKLFNFNIFIINRLCKLLIINKKIGFTTAYKRCCEEKMDFRNRLLPGNFQANSNNWQPKYAQVFEDRMGFQPNLSILDLLFCAGPNALNLIKLSSI
jgi:hypothetical protein